MAKIDLVCKDNGAKWWLYWIPPEHNGLLAADLPKPLIHLWCHTGGFLPHLDSPDVSGTMSVTVNHRQSEAKQTMKWTCNANWWRVVAKLCLDRKMFVRLSTLHVLIRRYTSKLKVTHTQKHKQTDGKVGLRISNAGREAALHNVTRDVSGHEDQRRGSLCLPAPPLSQIITGPPKTRENNLIGMLFECFFPMAWSCYKLYILNFSSLLPVCSLQS